MIFLTQKNINDKVFYVSNEQIDFRTICDFIADKSFQLLSIDDWKSLSIAEIQAFGLIGQVWTSRKISCSRQAICQLKNDFTFEVRIFDKCFFAWAVLK